MFSILKFIHHKSYEMDLDWRDIVRSFVNKSWMEKKSGVYSFWSERIAVSEGVADGRPELQTRFETTVLRYDRSAPSSCVCSYAPWLVSATRTKTTDGRGSYSGNNDGAPTLIKVIKKYLWNRISPFWKALSPLPPRPATLPHRRRHSSATRAQLSWRYMHAGRLKPPCQPGSRDGLSHTNGYNVV